MATGGHPVHFDMLVLVILLERFPDDPDETFTDVLLGRFPSGQRRELKNRTALGGEEK